MRLEMCSELCRDNNKNKNNNNNNNNYLTGHTIYRVTESGKSRQVAWQRGHSLGFRG